MTVQKYLERTYMLKYDTTFRMTPEGEGVYILNGIEYTREELHRKFPLPVSLASNNKPNYDGTKNWLLTE
jgi:hypothetical protein